ncbi:43180_t:CDS:1, partial [Gigaspora margarita]
MSAIKRNYKIYCEDNLPSKNKTSFKKVKTQKLQPKPSLKTKFTGPKNSTPKIIDISNSDNDELPLLKTKSTGSKNLTLKIIDISDSSKDELLSLKTMLKNISKLTRYKKINNIEFIEIQDDTTAANNNKDDFTYTINDVRFLRISKKTIRSKLKGMVKRLKSKKTIRYIAEICKQKERY